jgi:hypothetical protein
LRISIDQAAARAASDVRRQTPAHRELNFAEAAPPPSLIRSKLCEPWTRTAFHTRDFTAHLPCERDRARIVKVINPGGDNMSRFSSFALGLAVIVGAAIATANVAAAQPIRTYLALTGSDSNPCTFAQPCKSAQHAHDVVAAGGEIRMLDPGSFGLVTITKAVSILGDGHGGIAAQNGATAITINAGPNDAVNLRGLVIDGFGSGLNGVTFNSGSALIIEDSIIRRFSANGINFVSSTQSSFDVVNTVVTNNGNAGILDQPRAQANLQFYSSFTHVQAIHNGNGILVSGNTAAESAGVNGVAVDCTASSNGNAGFAAVSGGGFAVLSVTRSVAVGNAIGVAASAGGPSGNASAFVGQSDIGMNVTPADGNASLNSYGDNNTFGNGTLLFPIPLK